MILDYIIKNGLILTSENDFVPYRGNIGIKDEKIVFVHPLDEDVSQYESENLIDASEKVILPGLFNNHCHGDMTMARGFGDGLTLFEQNELFSSHNWFYKYTNQHDRYVSRQMTYVESLLNGVTFITENMYWSLGLDSIKAMREVGIKGALVEDIRENFITPDVFISDEYIYKFIKECEDNGLIPVIGGISEEDFKHDRLKSINEKIREFNIHHTSHLAENQWRYDLIKESYNQSPIDFMHSADVLHSKYLGSHVVKVDDDDINLLRNSNSHVVSTPICEMKIQDGIAPISKMIDENINVSLGTDGALWNNDNDIFLEMKQTSLVQSYKFGVRSIGHKDILKMATINGARTYGIEDKYGSIAVGKSATLIMLDINKISWQPVRENDYENITSNIVFNTSGTDVTDVFVDGKHLVQNKVLETFDVEKLKRELNLVSEKIINGLNKEFKEDIL